MHVLARPYSRAQLEMHAELFRAKYAPSGQLGPLDVERAVELCMRLPIVPRVGVREQTGKHGWLACDGRTIIVDAEFQLSDELEYQSFLAHEVSHHLLHRRYLPYPRPRTALACARFVDQLSPETVMQIEFEAKQLAARIQMPTHELHAVFADAYEHARDRYPRMAGPAWTYVYHVVARHFGVTPIRADVRTRPLWRAAVRTDNHGHLRPLPVEWLEGAMR